MNKSGVSIIAAMDEKRGIGKGNNLLFRIPEDMKRMKALTTGHPLIMGRKTFESLGRLLPERPHIVITRDPARLKGLNYQPHFIASTLEEGLEIGKKCDGGDEVFIFGGGQVYSEALKKELVDKLYLTVVKGDFGADTFFPEYRDFKIISSEKYVDKNIICNFLELERK